MAGQSARFDFTYQFDKLQPRNTQKQKGRYTVVRKLNTHMTVQTMPIVPTSYDRVGEPWQWAAATPWAVTTTGRIQLNRNKMFTGASRPLDWGAAIVRVLTTNNNACHWFQRGTSYDCLVQTENNIQKLRSNV